MEIEKTEETQLEMEITYGSMLKFALPTMISMLVMSTFGSVDGFFASRLISSEALAATMIFMPVLMVIMAIAFMLSTGGSALVAKKIGEGLAVEARQNFSLIILTGVLIGAFLSILSLIFIEPIIFFLGAGEDVFDMVYQYAIPIVIALPFLMIGAMFQQFFMTAGRPTLGMAASITAGVIGSILNFSFLYFLDLGIAGLAYATVIGQSIPTAVGILFFTFNRKQSLYFVIPKFDIFVLVKSSTNGISEMIASLAYSVFVVFMNNILQNLSGTDGIAAAGMIMIILNLLSSIFMGYAYGIAPIISYNYGKNDENRLKKIFSISLRVLITLSLGAFLFAQLFAEQLIGIFVERNTEVYQLALLGFRVVCISFLFMSINIFASSMFTALNNGKMSGLLSFLRTLVFAVGSLLILPEIFGLSGVWIALPVHEGLAFVTAVVVLYKMKDTYRYA